MKNIISITLLTMLILSFQANGQSFNDIHWMADEYPPWSYKEDGVAKGLFVDVLIELWKKVGINKSRKDIDILPWARAYKQLQIEPGAALFSMSKTDEREKLGFKWVGPIISDSYISIISKKKKHYKFDSIDNINKTLSVRSLGVVRADSGEHLFVESGGHTKLMQRVVSGDQLVKMLDLDRFAAVSFGTFQFVYLIKKNNINLSEYEFVYALNDATEGGYFGFNKDTDSKIIEAFQKEFDNLVSTGVVKRLLMPYQMNIRHE